MPQTPPTHPDIRRRLKDRLLDLSPRGFEYFAGDVLTFVGLQNVAVTRYVGDGGIDARGDLVAPSGLVRVPTGVQVKRHRQNVRRPDIDRFIGALGGEFSHGIFITTASYAADALRKASQSPLLRVDTINGEALARLMAHHRLGLAADGAGEQVDEDYFLALEARVALETGRAQERQEPYAAAPPDGPGAAVPPEDDLISMHALGYELRVDPYTVQDWVRRGRLQPDRVTTTGRRESFFFRRDRVDALRQSLTGRAQPATGAEIRQEFLDFARVKRLTRSYKPVLLKTLMGLVDRNGEARLDDLVRAFHAFYLARQRDGLPTEKDGPLLDPASASFEEVKQLIVKYPLDRFVLQHFLEYERGAGVVRFAPRLWAELRFYELLDVLKSADEQLAYYYRRPGPGRVGPGAD